MIPIHVPPLRERREDIPVLARAFVAQVCAEAGVRDKSLDPKAAAALAACDWPGNVRELKNLIMRVVLMTAGGELALLDLPHEIREPAGMRRKKRGALEDARREFERRFLIARLDEHAGNISQTARAIGMARESLSRKLRALKIQGPRGQ